MNGKDQILALKDLNVDKTILGFCRTKSVSCMLFVTES